MRRPVQAVVLALCLLLAACATIPVSGPVESVPVSPPPPGVEIAPEPPQPGITPTRLLDGFLQAMADPESNYAIARQYLAAAVREEWSPQEGTTVYDGAVSEADGEFTLSGTTIGRLDEHGWFSSVREPLQWPIRLTRESGEWRIASPPAGLLISQFIFDRYYAHATVYFMAAGGEHVVPQLIHVPDSLLTPTRIVEAQLAGPDPLIARAARNAIPPGTRLAPAGASVDQFGVAKIVFENLSADLGEEQRRALGAQLLWSLTSIPRVAGLQVFTAGGRLALPGQDADGILELASQQGYQVLSRATTADLFGVRDSMAGRVSASGSFVPLNSEGVAVSEVAVSLDGSQVAFVDESRRLILLGPLGGRMTHVVPDAVDIKDAQFVLGRLWVLGTVEGVVRLLQIDAQGRVSVLDTGTLPGVIQHFSGSQTGSRIVFVTAEGDARRLVVAGLDGGAYPAVQAWRELLLGGDSGRLVTGFGDVSWSSESQFAIVAEEQERSSVYLVEMDASSSENLGPLMVVPDEVSALPRVGGDVVAVRSASDEVFRFEAGSRWSRLDLQLAHLTYPG